MEQLLDKIAKASPAAKFGGLALLVAAISAANFFILVQPVEEKIKRGKQELSKLEDSLAEKEAIAQNLNERRREMDKLEQELAAALTKLPEKKEIDELLAQLNDIGKKSGLEIEQVVPGTEQPSSFFAKIPIKMAVRGNYHEVAIFLQEIANMRRIVNVNNIKFTAAELRNDKVVMKSEFLATTFRFVEQKQAPVTPAKGKAGGKK